MASLGQKGLCIKPDLQTLTQKSQKNPGLDWKLVVVKLNLHIYKKKAEWNEAVLILFLEPVTLLTSLQPIMK